METIITQELEEKIANAVNLEEVIQACKAEGIEITKEQLEAVYARQGGELDENALDNVAGGVIIPITPPMPSKIVVKLVKTVLDLIKNKGKIK